MIVKLIHKVRFWLLAAAVATLVGFTASSDAQAQQYRYDRARYGDGWTWYEGNYRPYRHRSYRGYDYGDRYHRSYYRGNYYGTPRAHYYDGWRGGGVRVGPVQVWW